MLPIYQILKHFDLGQRFRPFQKIKEFDNAIWATFENTAKDNAFDAGDLFCPIWVRK